jgi:glycogen synthase
MTLKGRSWSLYCVVLFHVQTEMRILLVSEDLPTPGMGGLARHVLALARALITAGHTVDLMGNDDYRRDDAEEKMTFEGLFFAELRGQFTGWKEMSLGVFMPWKRTLMAKRFARAILRRSLDYDVIHYHGHLPNLAYHLPEHINFIQTRHDQGSDCLIHTRFKNNDVCTSIDSITCAECRSKHPNAIQRLVSAFAVDQYRHEVEQGINRHKTIFVSRQLRSNMQRCFGLSANGMILHNFIDSESIRLTLAAQEKSTNPPLSDYTQVFIAAKLYDAKGVDPFLRTLARHSHESLQVCVAGSGPDEAAMRNDFPWVTFLGWQTGEQTLQLTNAATAIVVPSICEESCATTVLEALALGKVVFALRRGGTPELSIYANNESQLQLFDDMLSLVKGLLNFSIQPIKTAPSQFQSNAMQAARVLLNFYELPPGSLTTQY